MADQKIAGGYIELSVKGAEKVGPAIQQVKNQVDRALPAEDTGRLEKVLLGKRGAEGIEHSVLHAFGHLGKIFGAGGLFALGVGLATELGESLFKTATGFDATAKAAENAAKGVEAFKKATEEANRAGVAVERNKQGPLPFSTAAAGEQIGRLQTEIDKSRERANITRLSDEERAQLRQQAFNTSGFLPTEATIKAKTDAAEKAELSKRKESADNVARENEKQIQHLRNQVIVRQAGGFMAGMGQLGSGLTVAASNAAALGVNALNQFGGNALQQQLGAARLPNMIAQLRANQAQPGGLGNLGIEGLQNETEKIMAKQSALKERESLFAGAGGGPADIGSIGMQMQQALFNSPFQEEQMRLDKERNELLTEIQKRIGGGVAGVAIVGPPGGR